MRQLAESNPSPAKMCVMPQWEFLASEPDMWKPFASEPSDQVEQAFNSCQARLQVTIDRYRYDIDLENLMQTNCQTSRKRAIRRQMVPDMQETVHSTIAAQEQKIRSQRSQMQRMTQELQTRKLRTQKLEDQLRSHRTQIHQLAQQLAISEQMLQHALAVEEDLQNAEMQQLTQELALQEGSGPGTELQTA